MSEPGEVSMKILQGHKLTRTEFEEAKRKKIYPSKATYENFLASYYEDDVIHGYLCGKHIHKEIDENKGCGYGLHTENLKAQYLTELNKRYLIACLGEGVLEHIKEK